MEIPDYQPFYLETAEALRAEIARLGLAIPLAESPASLAQPLAVGRKQISNRFCAQPIAGCDAGAEGAPGELTFRRYGRYASGGFGLIWVESTAAGSVAAPKQLCLNEGTLGAFRNLAASIRQSASAAPLIIIQLTSAPSAPDLSDDEIERRRDDLIQTARLAAQAGFDGVDIQCCHGALAGALLSGERPGKYGGSFENRTRFLLETLAGIREQAPDLLLAARLCAFDARRNGFGVAASDYRKPDLAEPVLLAQHLQGAGLTLLNVTASSPNLRAPAAERGLHPRSDADNPDEHPLMTLGRQLHIARALRAAAPGLAVVGSGFSWLRHFVPDVAAAAIDAGMIDFAGLGRGALAFPGAPADILARGKMNPGQSCMVCFACSNLRAEGEPVGCVIRDSETYGPVYRHMRRFDADHLLSGARRCHFCENAPCVAASHTRTDIPAFIRAFLQGDESQAYEIIRESNPLPEMTSQLAPAWMESEGACIENTLAGLPVPILDLQYTISWRARDRGESGAHVPAVSSGKRIAVVGGGPAGIAAALRLVEKGHAVDVFEQSDRLGGAPGRVIPASRLAEVGAEIDAAVRPAITAGRLAIHYGATVGGNVTLGELRAQHDAVLIAAGLWREVTFGPAPGALGALTFLETVKRQGAFPVPDRVAILAGGDGAMDAARTLQSLGAREIFVVFGGPRSAMHWHMPESWFATPGVHAMMNWQPLGFDLDETGRLRGVRLRHAELGVESVLPVGLVIEAMPLGIAESLLAALPGLEMPHPGESPRSNQERVYAAGAFVNGGASVGLCISEGLAAAEIIHQDLSS